MQLRSSTYIRSGQRRLIDRRSELSTQESMARTQSQGTTFVGDLEEDTFSESSMATTSSLHTRVPGIDYDGTLRFHKENAHGAKIYRDFIHRFAVKVEDHPSDFEPSPRVNYQGDRYMSENGVMYLLVDDPENVDTLGQPIAREPFEVEEGPPPIDLTHGQLPIGSQNPHR